MYGTDAGLQDPNLVTIEVDSLEELDAEGNTVGASGQERHSFNTFANQDFTFHEIVENHLLGTNASIHASANKLSFDANVDAGGIAVDTFIVTTAGLVGPEGEQWHSGIGDMKFNIRFPSWKWCGDAESNCGRNEVGQFLQVDIKMKGNLSEVALIPGTLNTYDLGGGANLTLTDFVMIDGEETRMVTGYPTLTMKGSSQIFRFRFPRFTTSAEYDPLLRQGWHWGQVMQAFGNTDGSLISASFTRSPFSILTFLFAIAALLH